MNWKQILVKYPVSEITNLFKISIWPIVQSARKSISHVSPISPWVSPTPLPLLTNFVGFPFPLICFGVLFWHLLTLRSSQFWVGNFTSYVAQWDRSVMHWSMGNFVTAFWHQYYRQWWYSHSDYRASRASRVSLFPKLFCSQLLVHMWQLISYQR